MQKAVWHGGYATQFWTRPLHRPYRSRRETLTAYSKKAIQRRLVLPLDAHDWGRALEVLGARYARLGRTVEDYKRLVRGLATETTPRKRSDAVHTLNMLRDKAYAGEIASGSLWVTLLWAYARLGQPQEGYECLLQAKRRANYSSLTWHHMGELLLPQLAESGMLKEVNYVVANFLKVGGSRYDDSCVAGFVAEAAARCGLWEAAIASLQQQQQQQQQQQERQEKEMTVKKKGGATDVAPATPFLRTLTTLFAADGGEGSVGAVTDSRQQVPPISMNALRCMMCAMADDGRWTMALQCVQELEGQARRTCESLPPKAAEGTKRSQSAPLLSESELQRLLNCLGSHQKWEEAVALFFTTHRCGEAEQSNGGMQPLHAVTLNLLFASFPRDQGEFHLLDLRDRYGLDVLNAAQPGEQKNMRSLVLQFDMLHHPQQAVAVLDRLLRDRDDVIITDRMMMAVGPALLQLGHWDRALHLLRQAPALAPGRPPVSQTESERHVRKQLVAVLYYLHGTISLEAECYTLYHFPHAFPKEIFRHLPPPSELGKHMQQWKQEQQKQSDTALSMTTPPLSPPLAPSTARRFASQRRTAIVHHTEQMDGVLMQKFTELYANRGNAFCTGSGADRDPRPPPKGLHDTASGWNFYGRGGEMVFANHRRTAHPFSLHPKIMRSLADPYRGWNLRQNSCWAHRERVKKWNGHSAV